MQLQKESGSGFLRKTQGLPRLLMKKQLLRHFEDEILQKGIEKLVSNSKTFSYLKDDEDLYTVNDLKEKYK